MIKAIITVLSIDLFHLAYRNWVKLAMVLGAAAWLAVLSFPDNKVKIVYCNAGQGDETLIQRGFTQILIDGSRPGRALDCLLKHISFFDRQIEMMIVSHPQLDHFGGLTDVVKRYKVMSFVYNGLRGDSREWEEFSKAVLAEKAKIEVVAAGDEIRVGEMKLKVLWPMSSWGPVASLRPARRLPSQAQSRRSAGTPFAPPLDDDQSAVSDNVLGVSSPDELNSGAVVMDFSYGEFDALFTGDIGEEQEREIVKRLTGQQVEKAENLSNLFNLSSVDILKVAHHGSKYSSSLDFLKAVRPALAVIEVGKNSYGHPTAETLARLKEIGAKVMRTDQDGEVVVITNGKEWKVKTNKLTNPPAGGQTNK